MSNSIFTDRLPSAGVPSDEQLARSPAGEKSDESWHRAFEHALGSSFDRWFQAPTERGDAMPNVARATSKTPTPTLASQPAALMFAPASDARESPEPAPANAGTVSRYAAQRSADATPSSGAGATAASAQVPAPAPTSTPTQAQAQAQAQAKGVETGSTALSLATQSLVVALGSLAGTIPLVGVESPSQAIPSAAATTPSIAAATRRASEDDLVNADVARAPAPQAQQETKASDEREPLRVYAEWSDAGVRVWLGADAQGLAEVDAVTRQLQQWLGSQGMRLLGVVCNGKPVLTEERDGATATSGSTAVDAAAGGEPDLPATHAVRSTPYPPISF